MKVQSYPSFDEEKLLWNKDILVIGIDEVGRGAFAGPIVAGAVIFPLNFSFPKKSPLSRVNDSKQVKPNLRVKLSQEIKKNALFWSVGEIDVNLINKKGVGIANKMVFRKVVASILKQAKDSKSNSKFYLLVDGFHVKFIRQIGLRSQKGIIKGDLKSFTIAAASIVAKVHRDNIMKKYHKSYPSYGFLKNKGYGTRDHRKAIREYGICKIHRLSFVESII